MILKVSNSGFASTRGIFFSLFKTFLAVLAYRYFSKPGMEPVSLQRKHGVLATGPLGNSPPEVFFSYCDSCYLFKNQRIVYNFILDLFPKIFYSLDDSLLNYALPFWVLYKHEIVCFPSSVFIE